MRRKGWAVATIFLFAGGSAGATDLCVPEPTGVDPVNGNFTPTTWVEGDLRWVNNAVGGIFESVWANTDFDMWFVGWEEPDTPIAAHFHGFSLQPIRLPGTGQLYGVWGSSSNDVWAVGTSGLIEHWDGTQWLTVPSGTIEDLNGVAGTSSGDVWAAGKRAMLHWDGTSWTNSPGFVPDPYWDHPSGVGLAAISGSDAIVATYQGCQRWDGKTWHGTNCGVRGGGGIFATSSDDIWVVGYIIPDYEPQTAYRAHWDGSSWNTTVVENQNRFWRSIAGTGPTDIWINGMVHYDGTTWTETDCGPFLSSMSVSSSGTIVGVSSYGFEYFAGNDSWPFLARTNTPWLALGGRDPRDLWAVSYEGAVIHDDGSRWSGQDFQMLQGDRYFSAAFGSSSSDIWGIAHNGNLRHFDGTGWTAVDGPARSYIAGFARTPDNAIAVDREGTAWHWDGTSWLEITLPIFGHDVIVEFWGTAPDDVWAVGVHQSQVSGAIYHWDGDTWQRVYSTQRGTVIHVGGSARDDAWFTIQGSRTIVVHWDGNSFTELDSFDGYPMGIAASGPNDVWLATCTNCSRYSMFQGDLRHYNGVSWNTAPLNRTTQSLLGIAGAGVFLVGTTGQIFQSR